MSRPLARRGRWLRATGLALLLTVLAAGPAAADPPGPTRYDSRVLGLEPATDGVEASILGGDSYLQLSVAEGHEVVVPGYDGEELYLRFDADGTVHENHRSASYFQNQARYGVGTTGGIPADAGPDAAPDWVQVSDDGTYAWHDHRIHWMSPATLPFNASTGEAVDPGASEPQLTTVYAEPVPIRVDGEPVGITGEVVYLPAASPLPTALAAVVALAAVLALGWRRPATGIVAGVVGAAVLAVGVSVPTVVGLATGVSSQPFQVLVPAIGLLVVGAGLAVRQRSSFALVVAGAGGVPLLVWVVANLGAVTAPIVPPGTVPAVLVRLAVGVAAGAGVGTLVLGVRDLFGGDALRLDPGPDPARA